MPIQILTLKLDGITAGDYRAWCRDPEPPALGYALRSVRVDADSLGDTITVTLDWNHAAPPAAAAAAGAGLPLLPGTTLHPLTTWAAGIDRPSAEERAGGGIETERLRPPGRLAGDQDHAREHCVEVRASPLAHGHVHHKSRRARGS